MNKRQQEIIDNLKREFNKLQPGGGKSFNLINIQPLVEKNNLIEQLRKEEQLSKEAWIEAAKIEARRILELLADDLPTIEVTIGGADNTILILSGRGSQMTIYIQVCRQRLEHESVGEFFNYYTGLKYTTHLMPNYAGSRKEFNSSSIEDLLALPEFLETLRKLL